MTYIATYLAIGLLTLASVWIWFTATGDRLSWLDCLKLLFGWPLYALFLLCVAYLWVVL